MKTIRRGMASVEVILAIATGALVLLGTMQLANSNFLHKTNETIAKLLNSELTLSASSPVSTGGGDSTSDGKTDLGSNSGSSPDSQGLGNGNAEQPPSNPDGSTPANSVNDPKNEPNDENVAQTDRERLQEILNDYQVDELPLSEFTPEILGKEFESYKVENLTEAEVALLKELSPRELLKLKSISEEAFSAADDFYPQPDDWEYRQKDWQNLGHNDAFRHTYLNAALTKEFGEKWTKKLTTAHEATPGNDPAREAQDLYNNELGRKIANENPLANEIELAQLTVEAIERGDSVVVDRDGNLQFSNSVEIGEHKVNGRPRVEENADNPR